MVWMNYFAEQQTNWTADRVRLSHRIMWISQKFSRKFFNKIPVYIEPELVFKKRIFVRKRPNNRLWIIYIIRITAYAIQSGQRGIPMRKLSREVVHKYMQSDYWIQSYYGDHLRLQREDGWCHHSKSPWKHRRYFLIRTSALNRSCGLE